MLEELKKKIEQLEHENAEDRCSQIISFAGMQK